MLGESGITEKRLAYFDPASDSIKDAPAYPYEVNDRFEVSGDFGLIQNGTLVDWKKKLPECSSFWISHINNKGCVLGIGYQNGSGVAQKLLVLPVSLKDIKKPGDADDIALESIPPKKAGESENDYIQRPLKDKQIAFIEPHGAADGVAPEMPHLVAKILGGSAGLKVKWKLIVEYKRGNGYGMCGLGESLAALQSRPRYQVWPTKWPRWIRNLPINRRAKKANSDDS